MKFSLKITLLVLSILILDCCGGPDAAYNRDDDVTISGRYLDANGKPLKRREIGLWVKGIEWFGEIPDFKAVTDRKGRFLTTQVGKHFMWLNRRTRCTTVANYHLADEPVTYMGFYPVKQNIELPDARLWQANLKHKLSGDSVSFYWGKVDITAGRSSSSYGFAARAGEDWYLWKVRDASSGLDLPSYIFQNKCTGWRITTKLPAEEIYDVDWTYQSETKSGKNLIPSSSPRLISAGKRCWVEGQDNPFFQITDQRWGNMVSLINSDTSETAIQYPSWVAVDLGKRQKISAVACYDLEVLYTGTSVSFEILEVYVSDHPDKLGEPVATIAENTGYLCSGFEPVKGRYLVIRVMKSEGVRITGMRELSVFGP